MIDPVTIHLIRRVLWGVAASTLLVSLVANLLLFRLWLSSSSACSQKIERLVSGAELASSRRALRASSGVAASAQEASMAATEEMKRLAAEQRLLLGRYWDRIEGLPPLPEGCGPGEARVDAFNERGE